MKKIKVKIKLQVPAGKATPTPPVGPALGQHGVDIMSFCNSFNEQTKELGDTVVPVEITIYEDRTFEFICKTSPAAILLKKAAGIEKGSGVPNKEKVGKVSMQQVRAIAEEKFTDLNARNIEQAEKIIKGTAQSMGIEIEK
jgi:large subunit ribosomal protein L11